MTASHLRFLQPDGWMSPRGYANGVAADGRSVFVAGQVGWNAQGQFETDDFVAQVEQALRNIVGVLNAGGAGPEHLVRLTWYVADRSAYLNRRSEIGAAYRRVIGRHFPAMSLIFVAGLLEERALVEIEATAVLPM